MAGQYRLKRLQLRKDELMCAQYSRELNKTFLDHDSEVHVCVCVCVGVWVCVCVGVYVSIYKYAYM